MADRLVSVNQLKASIKGAITGVTGTYSSPSEDYNRMVIILEGVSAGLTEEILGGPEYSFSQLTSDGIQSPQEWYGTEHYGHHHKNQIRLRRFPVNTVSAVLDNQGQDLVDPSYYQVDPQAAIIYRLVGHFYPMPRTVQVIYSAGFPVAGTNDDQAIQVPLWLRNACIKQCNYEWNASVPGAGQAPGATAISRPDGSVVFEVSEWLEQVQAVIDRYRRV